MRWDRLFADIEGSAIDAQADQRDSLADDLRDEQWGTLGWLDLLGGDEVRLQIAGLGEVVGRVVGCGDLVLVDDASGWLAVVPEAVTGVGSVDGRAAPAPVFRRTRRQFARALRDEGTAVRVVRRDGSVVEGAITAAGGDFVQLSSGMSRVTLPWSWIAALLPTAPG